MYAGWLLTNMSGNLFGAHQKFNRVSHRHLLELADEAEHAFPSIKQILHFEGKNGPDGLKTKSPGKNEPHHFYDPFDPDETGLLGYIDVHYHHLVDALKQENLERAAFEASWLSHALTDGLTPAHHYPYERELEELRSKSSKTRDSVKEKLVISGDSRLDSFKRNWRYWGAKGLFMTHGTFELGVAGIIKPLKLSRGLPGDYDVKTLHHVGIEEVFKRAAREIALLDMYDRFYKRGWTPSLAKDIREELAPTIVRVVTLAWYSALHEANANIEA